MAEKLRVNERVSIPMGEIELRAHRSSGPGGQHANVTASRVEAVFDVSASPTLDESQRARLLERAGPVVTAVAQDARSQARNRELALQRLAEKLATGLFMPRRRRPTKPSRASPASGVWSRSGVPASASAPAEDPPETGTEMGRGWFRTSGFGRIERTERARPACGDQSTS